jgi:hypothetical protein
MYCCRTVLVTERERERERERESERERVREGGGWRTVKPLV